VVDGIAEWTKEFVKPQSRSAEPSRPPVGTPRHPLGISRKALRKKEEVSFERPWIWPSERERGCAPSRSRA